MNIFKKIITIILCGGGEGGGQDNRVKILWVVFKPGYKGKLLCFCFYSFIDKSSKDIIDVSISELKQI